MLRSIAAARGYPGGPSALIADVAAIERWLAKDVGRAHALYAFHKWFCPLLGAAEVWEQVQAGAAPFLLDPDHANLREVGDMLAALRFEAWGWTQHPSHTSTPFTGVGFALRNAEAALVVLGDMGRPLLPSMVRLAEARAARHAQRL